MNDTICAISTPLGRGAISIVRMSGSDSLSIMKKVFRSKSLDYDKIKPRYLYFGNFSLGDAACEHCLAVYFKAPFSYTGEDIVEFQIHGGVVLTEMILSALTSCGARLAEPGEFTKRAFENGKIGLDMAESIIGEINAESEGELRASLHLADGALSKSVKSIQEDLTELLAQIEATLDYPEEDFEESTKEMILNSIRSVRSSLQKYIRSSQDGRLLQDGVKVAIVGATNVGKSSTLNALLGQERAIVTEIEGTTRDFLQEKIEYKGIKLIFIDTAGIRHSEDRIENIGIEKSKKAIAESDVVLCLLDASRPLNSNDREILELVKPLKNVIYVVNKCDLSRRLEKFPDEIAISALKDENIVLIKERIFQLVGAEKVDFNSVIISSARQLQILERAVSLCNEIISLSGASMDIYSMLIKNLWNELGKITGQCENESIIDLIFSKFCLGK